MPDRLSTGGERHASTALPSVIVRRMYSNSARRSFPHPDRFGTDVVTSVDRLGVEGWSASAVRAQVQARRWQRIGRAVIRHNGAPSPQELRQAALIVLGPRSRLTSFTALEEAGLEGWTRTPIHVLLPRGARIRRPEQLDLRLHFTDRWDELVGEGQATRAHSALLAAASFATVRPACGLIAATVQQGLLRPADLSTELMNATRLRHRRALTAATHDIEQGAHALSEIDFARLCRRHGLPEPRRQAVRREPSGRRRYVDAEWRGRSGRRVVAEVDGALHLIARRWWDDQLRQNELVIANDAVLRFPTVVVRSDPALVADQLRRALQL
jgi:hypothetical protein